MSSVRTIQSLYFGSGESAESSLVGAANTVASLFLSKTILSDVLVLAADMPASVWEYGVSIGVIILSFALIWRLINVGIEKFESVSKTFTASINALDEKHRLERTEWRQESKQREERITTVCDELIRTIHESKK